MRCVLVVLEGGIYSLLCGENSTRMLEGFFNYYRECFVYLFEFFLVYDRGLVMILDSVDYDYVVLVELLRKDLSRVSIWTSNSLSRRKRVVVVGDPSIRV